MILSYYLRKIYPLIQHCFIIVKLLCIKNIALLLLHYNYTILSIFLFILFLQYNSQMLILSQTKHRFMTHDIVVKLNK